MQDKFIGFYPPSEKQLSALWEDAKIVVDTNVLFALYRYSLSTRETLLRSFQKLSPRLFMPHQVALEYHRNRLEVIEEQCKAYTSFLSETEKSFNKTKETILSRRHPFIKDPDQIVADLGKLESSIKAQTEEKQIEIEALRQKDDILDMITRTFKGKVGKGYSLSRLEKLMDIGEKRYRLKIPPGYSDSKKAEPERYGDFIVWSQLLDYARETSKAILLVTEDAKEDWWRTHKGKTLGPRPELVQEMKDEAGVQFHSYSLLTFIEHAEKYLNEKLNKEAALELRQSAKWRSEFLNSVATQGKLMDEMTTLWLKNYQNSIAGLAQWLPTTLFADYDSLLRSLQSNLRSYLVPDISAMNILAHRDLFPSIDDLSGTSKLPNKEDFDEEADKPKDPDSPDT